MASVLIPYNYNIYVALLPDLKVREMKANKIPMRLLYKLCKGSMLLHVTFLLVLFSCYLASAQTIPDVASLNKFIDFPVDKATGIPSIQVPLYTVKAKDFSLPISFSYHAGGIRVEEMASNVGLGWALNAGGVISRSVKGFPDESSAGYYTMRGEFPPHQSETEPGANRAIFDQEPDIYTVSVNGYYGKFVFGKNRTIHLIQEQDIRVEVLPNTMFSWKITTPDGAQYFFDGGYEDYTGVGASAHTVSAWHLSRIISPQLEEITFTYQNTGGAVQRLDHKSQMLQDQQCPDPVSSSVVFDYGHAITKIASKLSTVEFKYKTSVREDYHPNHGISARALESILITDNLNNRVIKSFFLATSYFKATPPSTSHDPNEYRLKRLRLDEMRECDAAGNCLPPYRFAYNKHNKTENDKLPSRITAGQDHWGYYNGRDDNSTLYPSIKKLDFYPYNSGSVCSRALADREPNSDYKAAFILDEVTFPTGGVTAYFFESIPYFYEPTNSFVGRNSTAGGLRVKEIASYGRDGSAPIRKSYEYGEVFVMNGAPVYLQYVELDFGSLIPDINNDDCEPFKQYWITWGLGARHYMLFSDPVNFNGSFTSNYIVHSSVIERDINNGSIEYYYDTNDMWANEEVDLTYVHRFPFINTGVVLSTGKLLNQVYRDKSSRIVKEVSYEYNKYRYVLLKSPDIIQIIKPFCADTDFFYIPYEHHKGFIYLKQKTEINYADSYTTGSDGSSTLITKYEYGGLPAWPVQLGQEARHHQVTSESIITSDGTELQKKYKYPQDYTADFTGSYPSDTWDAASLALKEMVVRNIVTPVETITLKNKGGQSFLIGAELQTYKLVNGEPGKVHLGADNTFKLPNASPLAYTTLFDSRIEKSGSAYSLKFDPRYERELTQDHNAQGNLTQSYRPGGMVTSMLWGYESQLPVAVVNNALYKDIFYTGFESPNEGNSLAGDSKAGRKSFVGAYTKNLSGLTPGDYTLSYWKKGGSAWEPVSMPVQVTGGSYTISLDGPQVDEVRFFPVQALMVSYTYDPLSGVTSMADANNKLSFYSYDEYQRLETVKDQNGDILQSYTYKYEVDIDYNFTVYSNDLISQQYTKSDCATGTPSIVTYTVTAGIYLSNQSKQDANAKAWAEVSRNGQLYANESGKCLFYNVTASRTFTKSNCIYGSGNPMAYTVAAGTYSAPSQAEADALAWNDVNTKGQIYVDGNGTCSQPQTVYARVELENKAISTRSPGEYDGDEIQEVFANVYVRFYLDAYCTVRAILPSGLHGLMKETEVLETVGKTWPAIVTMVDVNATYNTSEVLIGNRLIYSNYEYFDPYAQVHRFERRTYTYELVNEVGSPYISLQTFKHFQ
ncbi:MAG: DUF5977 domain-containing protein [Pontibacter sp.]|nr:DUF5977 domain-containing protein [Pontibacter sp.]